jgi:enamine deaminase RidA (YjgF/YER057c/UK114 family)
MSTTNIKIPLEPVVEDTLSTDALAEMDLMGLLIDTDRHPRSISGIDPVSGRKQVVKQAISAPSVLNEAFDYSLPSSFTRGLRIEVQGARLLLLSGTASIDGQGKTVYPGDFEAQCLRTYRNLTELLAAEDASWHDVIRTTCYLRDIERDYDTFNRVRTLFFDKVGLDPLPASTGIQARLCRSDLLIEIEAMAMIPNREA